MLLLLHHRQVRFSLVHDERLLWSGLGLGWVVVWAILVLAEASLPLSTGVSRVFRRLAVLIRATVSFGASFGDEEVTILQVFRKLHWGT